MASIIANRCNMIDLPHSNRTARPNPECFYRLHTTRLAEDRACGLIGGFGLPQGCATASCMGGVLPTEVRTVRTYIVAKWSL